MVAKAKLMVWYHLFFIQDGFLTFSVVVFRIVYPEVRAVFVCEGRGRSKRDGTR